MIRGGAGCRHCRWRCDGTGYCLWPVCLRIRVDGGQGKNGTYNKSNGIKSRG